MGYHNWRYNCNHFNSEASFAREKASNYAIYTEVYSLANGVLSLKEVRSATTKPSASSLAALTSVVGGLVLIIT